MTDKKCIKRVRYARVILIYVYDVITTRKLVNTSITSHSYLFMYENT